MKMSKDWVTDINDMHSKFGVHEWVKNNPDKLEKFLEFRFGFLQEELHEGIEAMIHGDAEEVVDSLIDLCVVAIGTLDAFDVDAHKAWNRVHSANMSKERGIKESRPNPLGLPDLIKPPNWQGPDNTDNHGHLTKALKNKTKSEG
jgi:predicted HAD superfamily Cof-like phosphohydrolase